MGPNRGRADCSGKPKTFALVAAFGDQIGVVSEVQSTGSHLSPYRRSTSKAQGDVLNPIVLHSLDKAIAKIDLDSKRIYLALSSARMDGVSPSGRESVAIGSIVAALEKLPRTTLLSPSPQRHAAHVLVSD